MLFPCSRPILGSSFGPDSWNGTRRGRLELEDASLGKVEGAGEGDAGLAGFAALDAADAEEFLAALLQVGFDGLHIFRRNHQNHADSHIERGEQFPGIDLSES